MNYQSKITSVGADIYIDGVRLDPIKSRKVRNHSPDGFSWGYSGSGCAQLALALLLEAGTENEAVKYYQDFKFDHIAKAPLDEDFSMDAAVVYDWLERRIQSEN